MANINGVLWDACKNGNLEKVKYLVEGGANIHARYNNAFEDEFWRTHNAYKLTPHIDYKPKYTPPYYAPQETGYGRFNYESYVQNLKRI
jgi:hypothetical protein